MGKLGLRLGTPRGGLYTKGKGPECPLLLCRCVEGDRSSILTHPRRASHDRVWLRFIWEELDSDTLANSNRLVEVGGEKSAGVKLGTEEGLAAWELGETSGGPLEANDSRWHLTAIGSEPALLVGPEAVALGAAPNKIALSTQMGMRSLSAINMRVSQKPGAYSCPFPFSFCLK